MKKEEILKYLATFIASSENTQDDSIDFDSYEKLISANTSAKDNKELMEHREHLETFCNDLSSKDKIYFRNLIITDFFFKLEKWGNK